MLIPFILRSASTVYSYLDEFLIQFPPRPPQGLVMKHLDCGREESVPWKTKHQGFFL
jgi:hypothetical protein